MRIGIKIKKLRESKKISQNELSAVLGISQSKLCAIESSEGKSIDFNLIKKICNYFDVGFDYFLNEEENMKVKNGSKIISNNFRIINNSPEDILEQIKLLIEDNKAKNNRINELEQKIVYLKNQIKNHNKNPELFGIFYFISALTKLLD